MKKFIFTSLFITPILLFFYTLLFSTINLVYLLDIIFYIGLLALLIGSVMLIIQGQFFNAFVSTSKYFFSTINKREQSIRNFEGKSNENVSFKKEYPSIKMILILGALYFSFSLIASIVIIYLEN